MGRWKYNEGIQKQNKELGEKMYKTYMIPKNLISVFS